MRRLLLIPAAMFAFAAGSACAADQADPGDDDSQADQGGDQKLITTCVADRFTPAEGGTGGTIEPMEAEVFERDKGNEFARTEFRVKDQEKFPYSLIASLPHDNPDFVLIIFNDLNTEVGSAAEGKFGSEIGAKAGLRFDWNVDQMKDGKQEFVFMSCCRNATGECKTENQ